MVLVLAGGAGLQLEKYEVDGQEDDHVANIFIVTATMDQFLKAADQYHLLKRTHDGQIRRFRLEEKNDFENFEADNESFFLCSEQQYLLQHMLNHVICVAEDIKHVPGYPKVKVYKSRPVSKFILFSP